MKNKKNLIDDRPKYKVQIDYKTIITVRNMNAVKSWMQKFPAAKLIE